MGAHLVCAPTLEPPPAGVAVAWVSTAVFACIRLRRRNNNASKGAICSELSVTGNFHDTPAVITNGTNITLRDNHLVAPGSAWPPQARAIMAEAGPVDSPWRRSSAWRELGLEAEAAAAAGNRGDSSNMEDTLAARLAAARASVLAEDGDDDHEWCRLLKLKRRVEPGRSWGELSTGGQAEWMRRRCDRFFCKPDKMESQGVYQCVPVSPTSTT